MTTLEHAIASAVVTIQGLRDLQPQVAAAARLVGECLMRGRQLLVCGNGGSAADAADFATEFTCRFMADRRPFPAINLSACGSLLTATGNDYGFREIFARQVHAFGKSGDVLVAISTSGTSANVLGALHAAREIGIESIALLGKTGGTSLGEASIELLIPGTSTARIQEAHKFLLHVICEMAEEGWLVKK
jgi:D-sedoheptulose 7-phosphate isomerase